MGVWVKRNVILRAIVTDQLKEQVGEELQSAANEIEERIQQLEFSTKAYITDLQRADLQRAMAVRKQIEMEKQKQTEMRDALLERRAQIQVLENDTEVIRGTLESFVEIKEGDDLGQLLGGVEIVAKDDIVLEIRQLKPNEEPVEAPSLILPSNAQLSE
jgi:dsDNA-specific endonuclease/ATPase MutS2